MKMHHRILLAGSVGALACCASTSPYYYDDYYAYYPVAYDDAYYDAAMVSGYYYYPSAYYYEYKVTQAATVVAVVPPSVRLLLARWNATIDPACVTATTTGDADKDGIDAASVITFQCNSSAAGGGTAEVTGAVTVRDLNDTVSDAGYAVAFNGLRVHVVTATGAVTERLINGIEAIQKAGGAASLSRDVVINSTDTFPDKVERQSSLASKTLGTFVPEFVAGSTLITRGTLTLSGQANFTGPDGVVVVLTRRTDPTLHWNNDCTRVANSQGFDSGAIVYTSSRGAETRIVHNDCASVTVTNNRVPAR